MNPFDGLLTLLETLAGLKETAVHWRAACRAIACALLGAGLGNLFGGGAAQFFALFGFVVGVGVGGVWESGA